MIALAVQGTILGLSTGTYCLVACAPFMVPYVLAEGRPRVGAGLAVVLEFLAGRLAAYLVFAGAVGAAGEIWAPVIPPRVLAVAQVFAAVAVLVFGVTQAAPSWSPCAWALRRLGHRRTPFLLGAVLGLNVCPPFVLAMTQLIALHSIGGALIFFTGFFAGTAVLSLPLSLLAPLGKIERVRSAATLAAVLAGAWFLVGGILTLAR